MAKGNGKGKGSGGGTGDAAASAAGKVLRNPKSSKDDKKAAASDLAQKKPRRASDRCRPGPATGAADP